MIIHDDWDNATGTPIKKEYKLPDKVESIYILHDGGRISISINGDEIYQTASGTRDCCIEVNNE